MKTMLDKCAVAGDITQAIDRRGAWSCAITVIGGTESTAVKLQSCETADGTFEDFKTLIPSADASASQYKGFVVDISGAGNFIKVVGATMATCVLGDCDADVKKVAIKAGEVPSGADLENNKAETINVSTYTEPVEVTPTSGKDGMKKATITLSNIPAIEDNKTATINVSTYTEPVEIEPTEGKDGMKKATVTLTNIPSGGSAVAYAWKATYDEGGKQETYYYYTTFAKAPADKDAWKNEKILYVNMAPLQSYLGDMKVETGFLIAGANPEGTGYQKDSDTQFTVIWDVDDTTIFTRDDTKDFTLWN